MKEPYFCVKREDFRNQRLLRVNPVCVAANTKAAEIFARMKDYSTARKYAEKALALDPRNPSVLVNIAPIYCEMGEIDRGIGVLEQALGLCAGELDIPQLRLSVRSNLARAYHLKGDDTEARVHLEAARAIEEEGFKLYVTDMMTRYVPGSLEPNVLADNAMEVLEALADDGPEEASRVLDRQFGR